MATRERRKPKPYEAWIQLQCVECFRTDKNGITAAELGRLIALGEWTRVERGEAKPIRCYEDLERKLEAIENDEVDEYTCWGTHIGLCDRCQKVS